jgi:hypothetical protein
MHALKGVVHRTRKEGTVVLLSDVHTQPLVAFATPTVARETPAKGVEVLHDETLDRERGRR